MPTSYSFGTTKYTQSSMSSLLHGQSVASIQLRTLVDTPAQRAAQKLVGLWSRVSNLDDLLSRRDKEQAAGLFADFLIDNVALFRQVESPFRAGNGGGPLDLLAELERKAQRRG